MAWATDTVIEGHTAFQDVSFGLKQSSGNSRHWSFSVPQGYSGKRHSLQRAQLVKAGAHLAQLLEALWP